MKKFLAGLLAALMSLSPFSSNVAEDYSEFEDIPASVSEVEIMPMNDDYLVMPLASSVLVSVSSLGTFSDIISQFDTGGNNFVVPVFISSNYSDFFTVYNGSWRKVFFFYNSNRLVLCMLPPATALDSTGKTFKNASIYTYEFYYDSSSNYFCVSSYKYSAFVLALPPFSTSAYGSSKACYFSSVPSGLNSGTYILDISSFSFVDSASYIPPSQAHTLTVNYLYSEDNPAADPVTQELSPGEEYNIPSPEIEGYTPSIPLVIGTMPDEDLTIDVYYSKTFYPLTVKYQYQDGRKAVDDVTFQYPMGFAYDIPSPEIAGYTPDKPTVSGVMPGKALEEVVTYSPKQYTLSIFYQYQDGTQAAAAHQEQLAAGASYSVSSPTITGYKPDHDLISGTMPAKDTYFTVIYKPDSSGGSSSGGGSGGGDSEGDGDDGNKGGGDSGGGDNQGGGDDDGDDDNKGGGNSGGGSSGSGGGWTGNDPFVPNQPPFSGYDPFDMPDYLPDWNNCPFHIWELPGYTYDPFVMSGG